MSFPFALSLSSKPFTTKWLWNQCSERGAFILNGLQNDWYVAPWHSRKLSFVLLLWKHLQWNSITLSEIANNNETAWNGTCSSRWRGGFGEKKKSLISFLDRNLETRLLSVVNERLNNKQLERLSSRLRLQNILYACQLFRLLFSPRVSQRFILFFITTKKKS